MSTTGSSTVRVFLASHDYGRYDLSQDVVSITTTKNITGSGSWNLVLVPSRTRDYLLEVGLNDWVEIYMTTAGGSEQLVMWGPVNQVMRNRTGSSGAVVERILVNGSDWVRALESIETFFDPLDAGVWEYPKFMQVLAEGGALNDLTAAEVVKLLVTNFLETRNVSDQFVIPQKAYGAKLKNILDLSGLMSWKHSPKVMIGDYPPQLSGNLMSALDYFADRARNYFFGDMKPVTNGVIRGPGGSSWAPAMYLDELPFFVGDMFTKLQSFSVTSPGVVRSESLGWNTGTIKNWFRVEPDMFGYREAGLALLVGPIINKWSIERYGLRRLTTQSPYSFPPTSKWTYELEDGGTQTASRATTNLAEQFRVPGIPTVDTSMQVVADLCRRESMWYTLNEIILDGTLECNLIPEARVNQRVDYTDKFNGKEYSFYVEQVSHHWQFSPPGASTILAVTRGQPATPEFRKEMLAKQDQLEDAGLTKLPPTP